MAKQKNTESEVIRGKIFEKDGKMCQEVAVMTSELDMDELEKFKSSAKAMYNKYIPEAKPNIYKVAKLFALGLGIFAHETNRICKIIAEQYNIAPIKIENSMLYRSFLRPSQLESEYAYGILLSENNDAILQLFREFRRLDTTLDDMILQTEDLVPSKTASIDNTVIKVEEIMLFYALPLEITELMTCAGYLLWLNLNNYTYDGGLPEQLVGMYIITDENHISLNTLGKKTPAQVDDAGPMSLALGKMYIDTLFDTPNDYHDFESIAFRFNNSVQCDGRVLMDQLFTEYPEEATKYLSRALCGAGYTYAGKLIRYHESAQAKELIDICVIADILTGLLLHHINVKNNEAEYLEKQIDDLKVELSKERKSEKDLERTINEYKLRTSSAEAAFATKEKELLKRIEILEAANHKLSRENVSLQKKIAENTHDAEVCLSIDIENEDIEAKESETVLPSYEEMVEILKSLPIVVVGGHINWVNSMKTIYPDWNYIQEKVSQRIDVFKNASIILFATDHLNHPLFHQAMNNCSNDTKIFYVHKNNIKACTTEIYEQYIDAVKR